MTTKSICKEGLYISPALEVLDLKSEGVLCESKGNVTIKDWTTEDGSVDFI